MIQLHDDFRDLLIALADARADFVVIGGYAAGISFDEATSEGAVLELEGRTIPIIGRRALITNKRTVARAQDLADVEALEALEE